MRELGRGLVAARREKGREGGGRSWKVREGVREGGGRREKLLVPAFGHDPRFEPRALLLLPLGRADVDCEGEAKGREGERRSWKVKREKVAWKARDGHWEGQRR